MDIDKPHMRVTKHGYTFIYVQGTTQIHVGYHGYDERFIETGNIPAWDHESGTTTVHTLEDFATKVDNFLKEIW